MIKEMLLVLRIFFVASLKLIQRLNGVFPAGVKVLVNHPLDNLHVESVVKKKNLFNQWTKIMEILDLIAQSHKSLNGILGPGQNWLT